MLANLPSFFENIDVLLAERPVRILPVVLIDELRKPQGTRHACRPAANNDDVSFHLWTIDACEGSSKDHFRRGEASYTLVFFTSSVSAGTMSNKLPTTPTSAISKMGASASLFIAMILFEPFIPTMC